MISFRVSTRKARCKVIPVKSMNDHLIQPNPNIPMDVVSVGSNP